MVKMFIVNLLKFSEKIPNFPISDVSTEMTDAEVETIKQSLEQFESRLTEEEYIDVMKDFEIINKRERIPFHWMDKGEFKKERINFDEQGMLHTWRRIMNFFNRKK